MEYYGYLQQQIEQWFNEHFTFDASHIPDTEEAYPEFEKFCKDFIDSVKYEDAKQCLEDLNAQRYDYDKLCFEWVDDIYKYLKKYADKVTFYNS